METISVNAVELLAILKNTKENTITIENESHSVLRKSRMPQVFKDNAIGVVTGTYEIGGKSYAERVNSTLREIGKKENFKPKTLAWGNWIIPNVAMEYNGTVYLRCYYTNPSDLKVRVEFDEDRLPIDYLKSINAYKGVNKYNIRQAKAGVEGKYTLMNVIKLDSIRKIVLGDKVYVVNE